LNEIRAQDYAPIRVFFHPTEGEKAVSQAMDFPEQIRSLLLSEGHYASGRSVQELKFDQFGAKLVDVRRGAIKVPGRLSDTRLRAGDVLLLKGERDALERTIARLTEGG
jgi:CPA2 family monovalent cation:H+ antiporter-2